MMALSPPPSAVESDLELPSTAMGWMDQPISSGKLSNLSWSLRHLGVVVGAGVGGVCVGGKVGIYPTSAHQSGQLGLDRSLQSSVTIQSLW